LSQRHDVLEPRTAPNGKRVQVWKCNQGRKIPKAAVAREIQPLQMDETCERTDVCDSRAEAQIKLAQLGQRR
jgi:hypothetical protein